ncbi:alpha/beta hydrolase [Jiangella ureilytica]|uniref:Alpha/beta hydrolase n=1 Tax=Jiangella ureilytica TaxID=2530374 RepID=A0A4R4RVU4_9ACTN|nr:alpha/beta hydrolase [Jiangella ureilytica]TDC53826.1 alpha/beta hydrolase [Jiangella ureilytica]
MRLRALAGLMALAVAAAAGCSAEPEREGQRADVPDRSTPAPDATEGVEPELATFYTQTLEWRDCGEGFQCSTATVPVDYAGPGGETLELALLRAPATGEERIGSLLVNPGGPGASGVEYAQLAGSVVTDQVRERYDIVGFDPRGVAQSTPVDCVDDPDLDEYLAADATPDDDAEITALEESTRDLASGCAARSGDLVPHIGTADVARDLDVLRAALGDEKLHFLGKSYGTFIGALYADQFPDRVGRLVLDGAIDPTLSGDDMGLGQARGFERALSAFLAWCFDQDSCALGSAEGEARANLAGLLQRADEEPLATDDENRPLTEALAFYGIILPLYLTADEGYEPLNEALDLALTEDDGTLLMTFADLYLERNSDGTYNGNANEVIGLVNCLDHPEQATAEQAEAGLAEFTAVSQVFGPFLAWGGFGCTTLAEGLAEAGVGDPADPTATPTATPAPHPPVTAPGADPILVVGTTGDPATPYEWAESLAAQLSSGVLLTFDSTVHTAYLAGSHCIDDAVDAYLLAGTVPDEGTSCAS